MILSGLAVVAIGVVAFFMMSSDDAKKDEPKAPAPAASNGLQANPANEFASATGKGEPATAAKPTDDSPTKAELKPLADKVDMAIWHEVEALFQQARKLKAEATEARDKNDEKTFEKKMGEAVREWRKGDLRYDDWKYIVDALHPKLIDTWFKKQDKVITDARKEFRSWLKYEDK